MDSYQIRRELYSAASLYEGFDPADHKSYSCCYDGQAYADYCFHGRRSRDFQVTLARTLHDHSVSEAMHRFLEGYDPGRVVGVMGGHAMHRSDAAYRQVALLSKHLTERGRLMVSGGGPGAMEATHLGAWMADRPDAELDDAIRQLVYEADTFREPDWLGSAFRVMDRYPQGPYESLGIPTWLYGHEPATPFATRIAKFYENSIREDSILSIAVGGIVFTPGSAGTVQEIFQEAAQDHYVTVGVSSPMAFLGKQFYMEEIPVYPFLQDMLKRGKYKNLMLSITDDPEEVVQEIIKFKPEISSND
ncbi:MAG: hypothetical protein K5910_03695 [Bacteroidales bacterium]|nr:hypothetical protein [Bacteroidales bacterium]